MASRSILLRFVSLSSHCSRIKTTVYVPYTSIRSFEVINESFLKLTYHNAKTQSFECTQEGIQSFLATLKRYKIVTVDINDTKLP